MSNAIAKVDWKKCRKLTKKKWIFFFFGKNKLKTRIEVLAIFPLTRYIGTIIIIIISM